MLEAHHGWAKYQLLVRSFPVSESSLAQLVFFFRVRLLGTGTITIPEGHELRYHIILGEEVSS